ncbi:MAG: DEAD/DEAH box helicase, partial [Pseudomonas sp.]
GRDGQARGGRTPARDTRTDFSRSDSQRQEPAVKGPRDKQPLIVHKESKRDLLPSPEQLEQLDQLSSSRPRGEKPALLTRNRES